jgi:hypothetical protein
MSLLDKASLVVTPNAYKASKLYSVVPNTTLGDLDVVRATTATRVNSAGLIESVAVNIPRVDYTNGSCPSLLVEGQRTNLATNSDGNVSTYFAINVTNASSSFNSFTNAIQFPNTALALAYKTIVTTVQTYAISAFIKMDDNSVPILSASQTTGNVCLVIAGAVVTNNLKVESYGNNVYRLSGTATSAGINANNGVLRYDTQVLKSFKITGIQLEAASYPTSYIPTVASIQSRNADVISKTGISSLIGQTEGTLFCQIKNIADDNVEKHITLSDGTNNNIVDLYYGFWGAGSIYCGVKVAGTTQGGLLVGALTVTNMNKIAVVYKTNRFELWINGSKVAEDLVGTTFSGTTLSKLETAQNGANTFFGNINSIQLYKTALSSTELAQLTTL